MRFRFRHLRRSDDQARPTRLTGLVFFPAVQAPRLLGGARDALPLAPFFPLSRAVARVCATLRWRGESAANPSLNRGSDEFLESINRGAKTPAKNSSRQPAMLCLSLVIKIDFTQYLSLCHKPNLLLIHDIRSACETCRESNILTRANHFSGMRLFSLGIPRVSDRVRTGRLKSNRKNI